MTLLVTGEGENFFLAAAVTKYTPSAFPTLRLVKTNWTPAISDAYATVTGANEATFTGYAAILMNTGASWTYSGSNPATLVYAQQTFTSSVMQATQQIYGYAVTSVINAVNTCVWEERFSDGPYPITNLNDAIKITPTITLT